MKFRILAWCLALLVGSPALAQDGSEGVTQRTPESAQQFFSELAGQYPAYFRYSLGEHPHMYRDQRDRWRSHPTWRVEVRASHRIDRAESLGRCVTRFYFRPAERVALEYQGDSGVAVPEIGFIDVDWSHVTRVERNHIQQSQYAAGPRVHLRQGQKVQESPWFEVVYDTPNYDWVRAEAAAEFLRRECFDTLEMRSPTGF